MRAVVASASGCRTPTRRLTATPLTSQEVVDAVDTTLTSQSLQDLQLKRMCSLELDVLSQRTLSPEKENDKNP